MQMISDFMHFDTIAIWQKIAIWKVDGYNSRSVHIITYLVLQGVRVPKCLVLIVTLLVGL